jgi:hypothetical protein
MKSKKKKISLQISGEKNSFKAFEAKTRVLYCEEEFESSSIAGVEYTFVFLAFFFMLCDYMNLGHCIES